MQKVGHLVKRAIKKHKLENQIKKYSVCRDWERVIIAVFPHAENKTMAVAFENGILHVASISREIADQIAVYQKRIIYALNEAIGKELVYRIRCEY